MNILLVENDVLIQKITMQFLIRLGMNVTLASDKTDAVLRSSSTHFDLVLLDVKSPTIEEEEMTKRIRERSNVFNSNVPILAYTASTAPDTKLKVAELGMNDYVSKPLNPEEMHYKINHYTLKDIVEPRALNINFELYTDSEVDFKMDLVNLMINNLSELQAASYRSFYMNDPNIFKSIAHKVKSTLILLNDAVYQNAIENLRNALATSHHTSTIEAIHKFNFLTESMFKALEAEITVLRKAC